MKSRKQDADNRREKERLFATNETTRFDSAAFGEFASHIDADASSQPLDSVATWRGSRFLRSKAILASLALHLLLATILASIVLSVKVGTFGLATVGGFVPSTEMENVDEVGNSAESIDDASALLDELQAYDVNESLESILVEESGLEVAEEISDDVGTQSTLEALEGAESGEGTTGGGAFASRDVGAASRRLERRRGEQGRRGDVTKESEDAVERGLDWLARHQYPDGGWAFELEGEDDSGRQSGCQGCSNSTATSGGETYRQPLFPNRTSATAIALLPFLGAGYTHTEPNRYQKTVASGLRYLQYRAVETENGIDFRAGFSSDGAAYVQALATLAICEAYEMTRDADLKRFAEGGLQFIERSQLDDGGWRYFSIGDPAFHSNVPGDTSVLAWQIMALKSGSTAGFELSRSTFYRAGNFLDSVMEKNGRLYRYQPTTSEPDARKWGTTAAGALSREYMGWEPGVPELDACAKQLEKWIDDVDLIWKKVKRGETQGKVGSKTTRYFRDDRMIYNLYFAYYASLALRHYGGKKWTDCFAKVRDLLVATQARGAILRSNCESGSWLFYDQYMNDGGRLLNTSLAILILETPYRFLPMYR